MIKAYLVGIPTYYENEDIEIRYRIYQDEARVAEKSTFKAYQKPSLVGYVALLTLLNELKKLKVYKDNEIIIIINDASLNNQIKGTVKINKADAQEMANLVRDELNKFKGLINIKDVSGNPVELKEWNDRLHVSGK